jgi:glycosyltransferase involved in cell wall biosynthesis
MPLPVTSAQPVEQDPAIRRDRPRIAFFDYPDVFEDFYSHYGVSQQSFATSWADTANHAWVRLIQREIGDVRWFEFSIAPKLAGAKHKSVGCDVRFLKSSRLHRVLWRLFYLPKAAWKWRRFYGSYATVASYLAPCSLAFVTALREERPDVLCAQSYASGKFDVLLFLARARRVPLLVFHSGEEPGTYSGHWVKRWTIRRADWIFASGERERQSLMNRYGAPASRINIIRPAVDLAVFRPLQRGAACAVLGLDANRRYILFCGRLEDAVKRVSAIIRAFATAAASKSATLLVAGDGADRARLERLANESAAGRVQFLGWISDPEMKAQLYNAAECLVLASTREGAPAVVSEALACGTPVVATDVGAISDLIVSGETGWLLQPADDDALASALADVLAQPEHVAAMRATCRQMAESHVSAEVVTAALKSGFAAVGIADE